MKVSMVCTDTLANYVDASIGIEAIPGVTPYTYAPVFPRIYSVDILNAVIDMSPRYISAAASILKVAAWANGFLNTRTWDTESIPTEIPQPGEVVKNDTTLSGTARSPVYNCASLPHFAIGLPTLQTLGAPVNWVYGEAEVDSTNIVRLLPSSQDPNVESISEGHWMIGLGTALDVLPNSYEALEVLGSQEPISLHVNGGDGPLLISSTAAVIEFYERQYGTDINAYTATLAV